MHRKLSILLLALFLFNLGELLAIPKEENPRPNIIFILADDLIFDGINAYGRGDVKTPNINKIALSGTRFTRFYNTTAICMASRVQYMTGTYEFTNGCNFDRNNLAEKFWNQSYPSLLKNNGYITGFAGKLGFRIDDESGKSNIDLAKSAFDWWCGWLGQGKYEMPLNKEAEAYIELYGSRKEHTTYALGLMGKAFIRKYANDKKPFCLSVSFKAPHTPYQTDKRYDSVYYQKEFNKPGNYGYPDQLPKQAIAGRPYSKGKSWLKDYDGSMRNYHQMVYGMDVAVGMIMDELSSLGLDDNTVIIFASDNGHFNGVKGLAGKLYPYEEGALSPLLIYDPRNTGRKNKDIISTLTANVDIAPTILDFASVNQPASMQGTSLLPLLNGEKKPLHKSILLINAWGARASQSIAVVNEHWKYIHWFYGTDGYNQTEELYDMQNDRLELHDLSNNPEFQEELAHMQAEYDSWLKYWKNSCDAQSDYNYYPTLAKRNANYEDIPRSSVLKMGKALTEKKRKSLVDEPKNILFIMSDDHSADAIGAYNSFLKDYIKSPTIDWLANEGVLFTNAFCTNSLCTPSRASILTGKYSHKSGVFTLREELNTNNIPTLPKLFKDHGYQTAVFGKWHLHGDNLKGFDNYAITKNQGSYINPAFETKAGKLRTSGYSTDVITDLSIEWLEKRKSDKPFILLTHYKATHGPWQYADRHKHLYENVDIPEPTTLFDNYQHRAGEGVPKNQARIHNPGSKMSLSYWFQTNKKGKDGTWPTGQLNLDGKNDLENTKLTYQKYIKDYMRCVKGIDEGVEKMINYLRETGELENTIIIYTSDQGMYIGEHNFFDKRLGLDEAMRIPLIIKYPEKGLKNTKVDELVNNVDITSTLLDIAGISQPNEMQGISFKSLLTGEKPDTIRKTTFYAFYSNGAPKHFGVRTKRYKLLKYVDKNGNVISADLFDLLKDPNEMMSLYDDKDYQELKNRMEITLKEEFKRVDIHENQLPGKQNSEKPAD